VTRIIAVKNKLLANMQTDKPSNKINKKLNLKVVSMNIPPYIYKHMGLISHKEVVFPTPPKS